MRGDAVCFQLQQNEVRFGGICLDIFPCGKLCEGFSSFFGNEGLCFLMELKIRKDTPPALSFAFRGGFPVRLFLIHC